MVHGSSDIPKTYRKSLALLYRDEIYAAAAASLLFFFLMTFSFFCPNRFYKWCAVSDIPSLELTTSVSPALS